ncbi:MAG: hypothetical protein AAGH41_06145 [Pseudomonadota bacterium]
MSETVFNQKRLAHRTRYEFRASNVGVKVEDNQAAVAFDQPYEEIPFEQRTFTEKMMALRAAAIFFLVMAAYRVFEGVLLDGGTAAYVIAGIQVVLAGAAEWGYRRTNVAFTVIDATQGSLFVINDKVGARIMAEITARRRQALRTAAGDINLENPIDFEVEKFKWLLDHDVITQDEHDEKLSALGQLASLDERPDPTRLH